MTPQPAQNFEERRLVLSVLGGLTLLVLLIGVFVLLPLRRERGTLKREIDEATANLRPYQVPDGNTVYDQLLKEKAVRDRLKADWNRLVDRVQTLKPGATLADVLSSSKEGRIDFKVALFDARNRIGKKAADKAVELPTDLGVPETIGADEDTETRLWQLAATVLLLEQAIDLGIPVVTEAEALPHVTFPLTDSAYDFFAFYPVHLQLACSYTQLQALLEAVLGKGTFFAVERVRVEKKAPTREELDVDIICGAVVFKTAPPPAPVYEDGGDDAAMSLDLPLMEGMP